MPRFFESLCWARCRAAACRLMCSTVGALGIYTGRLAAPSASCRPASATRKRTTTREGSEEKVGGFGEEGPGRPSLLPRRKGKDGPSPTAGGRLARMEEQNTAILEARGENSRPVGWWTFLRPLANVRWTVGSVRRRGERSAGRVLTPNEFPRMKVEAETRTLARRTDALCAGRRWHHTSLLSGPALSSRSCLDGARRIASGGGEHDYCAFTLHGFC